MKQERLFELHAEVCKTLSNPVRLRIINELQDGEITVGSLAKKLGIRQAHVSQAFSCAEAERSRQDPKGWSKHLLCHIKPKDCQGIQSHEGSIA